MELVTARRRCCGAMTAGANGGLEYSPRWGCVANTAYNKTEEPPAWGLSVLRQPKLPPARRPRSWIEMENLLASGHRVQTWSKVERQHFRVLPFCVSPLPSGKLVRIGTLFYIGGQIMAQARTSYHKEVKTASFQGRTITVENLTPILAPKVRDKRKREIETGLYSVFRKYAPGRAEMR